jgi:hypothetical protein
MRELLDPSRCAIFVLEIVEDRNGRGGALITSQISVYRWHDFFGEPTLAVAIHPRADRRQCPSPPAPSRLPAQTPRRGNAAA